LSEARRVIPATDVKRRFARSLFNFFTLYKPLLDSWMIFNNASLKPELIAIGNNEHIEITDQKLFDAIEREATK